MPVAGQVPGMAARRPWKPPGDARTAYPHALAEAP